MSGVLAEEPFLDSDNNANLQLRRDHTLLCSSYSHLLAQSLVDEGLYLLNGG